MSTATNRFFLFVDSKFSQLLKRRTRHQYKKLYLDAIEANLKLNNDLNSSVNQGLEPFGNLTTRESKNNSFIEPLYEVYNQKFSVNYLNSYDNLLDQLADRFGTDKCGNPFRNGTFDWTGHTYANFYSSIFSSTRFQINNVFECGIGTTDITLPSTMGLHGIPGASLRMWREYFPNANIFGGDLDRNILFTEDRIRTHFIDQLSIESIDELAKKFGSNFFDVIIDDGLHTFEANINLFASFIQCLSDSGVYIIEDVVTAEIPRYEKYFAASDYNTQFINISDFRENNFDNNLIIVRKIPK